MRSWTIAFCTGVLLAACLPALPPLFCCQVALGVGLLLQACRALRVIATALLGAAWLSCVAHARLADRWPEPPYPSDVWADITVWTMPVHTTNGQRILARLSGVCLHADRQECDFASIPNDGRLVQLTVYEELELRPGQQWRWRLRLRPPHGFVNPGGFDYEAWLLQQNISATGYLRSHVGNALLEAPLSRGLERARQQLGAYVDKQGNRLRWPHLLKALTIGEDSGLSDEEWDLLAATGTTHLLVISGSHVALVALFCYRVIAWLASRSTWLLLYLPAQWPGVLGAVFCAWCYTGIAGFSLPAWRASVMVTVMLLAQLFRRQIHRWHSLCLALVAVLVWDPLAVMNVGFWLSFVAVAVLLQAETQAPERPNSSMAAAFVTLWRTQWQIGLVLLPIVLVLFQQTSLLAPLVNLPLIPLIGFGVVPLALVGTCVGVTLPELGLLLLHLSDLLLSVAIWILETSDRLLPTALVTLPHLRMPFLILMTLAVGMAWLAVRRWQRWVGLFSIPCLLVVGQSRALPKGNVEIVVMDVGQGLAVLVQTHAHAMLYDVGPRFSEHFNAGDDVVMPVVRHANIRQLDRVMVSHADQDHAGGLPAIVKESSGSLFSSSTTAIFEGKVLDQERCRAGQHWTWDGVEFDVLHPDHGGYDDNNGSCVLRIRVADQVVLLTGDIEAQVESNLLRRQPGLKATVVVAPHHGSKSSSSIRFVRQLRPSWVIYSSGYQNRYGHPATVVQERYREVAAQALTTALDGAVTVRMALDGTLEVYSERRRARRFWRFPG